MAITGTVRNVYFATVNIRLQSLGGGGFLVRVRDQLGFQRLSSLNYNIYDAAMFFTVTVKLGLNEKLVWLGAEKKYDTI